MNFLMLNICNNYFSGKLVIKKWSGARDNWMRCSKKLKEYKSGSGAKSVTKYKFYEQMLFLNKVVCHRPTESNLPLAEEECIPNTKENEVPKVTVPKKRKKKDIENEIDRKISGLVDSVEKEENSRIMTFFRGIAPTIEKFNDADIVEFQYEVIKAMRNITQRTRSPLHSQTSHASHYGYNSTSAPHYSQTAYTSSPQNPYRGYRTVTAISTNYNVHDREYEISIPETPENILQSSHQIDDTVSVRSPTLSSLNDFDFSKSVDYDNM